MDLKKMALVTLFLGIASLAILSFNLEPSQIKISEISEKNLGEFVKMRGEVIKISKGSITSFDITDEFDKGNKESEIRVISFDKVGVSIGDYLEIIGKVDEYHGILEINAEKITKIGQN